jgi:hypothetical protein
MLYAICAGAAEQKITILSENLTTKEQDLEKYKTECSLLQVLLVSTDHI